MRGRGQKRGGDVLHGVMNEFQTAGRCSAESALQRIMQPEEGTHTQHENV